MIADELSSTDLDEAEKYYGIADESLSLSARQFREAILLVPEDERSSQSLDSCIIVCVLFFPGGYVCIYLCSGQV